MLALSMCYSAKHKNALYRTLSGEALPHHAGACKCKHVDTQMSNADEWLDMDAYTPDSEYEEFAQTLTYKISTLNATDYCLRNPDLCRLIVSYCDRNDLLRIGLLSKLWNETTNFQFQVIQNQRENLYMVFKSHPKYDNGKKKISRLFNNRENNTSEVYLLGGAMHGNRKTTYMLKDSLYPISFKGDLTDTPHDVVCSAGAADLAGNYHLFGGWKDIEQTAVSTVLKFDFNDPQLQYTPVSPLPWACCFGAVDCTIQGDFVHTGGGDTPFNGAKCHADVFLLRSGAQAWEEHVIPSMHSVRCGHRAATLLNDNILVAGGYAGNNVFHNSVELLDSQLDRWTVLPSMKEARSGAASVVGPGGAMYMVGGTPNSSDSLKSLERYDPREGKWTALAPMLDARSFVAGCPSVHHGFYVMGGMSGGMVCDSIEFYDFRTDRWEYIVGGATECPELNKISAYMTLKF